MEDYKKTLQEKNNKMNTDEQIDFFEKHPGVLVLSVVLPLIFFVSYLLLLGE